MNLILVRSCAYEDCLQFRRNPLKITFPVESVFLVKTNIGEGPPDLTLGLCHSASGRTYDTSLYDTSQGRERRRRTQKGGFQALDDFILR